MRPPELPVSRQAKTLTSEVIHRFDLLEADEAQWRALWRRSAANPFQSPDWLIPWWRAFASGELTCLVLARDGQWLGCAPCYILDKSGQRSLRLIGEGISDYLGPIAETAARADFARALSEFLTHARESAATVEFTQLLPDSVVFETEIDPAVAQSETWVSEYCPAVNLAEAPAWLKRLDYDRRRLAKLGRVRIERATAQNAREFFDQLIDLHRARWDEKGEGGVLSDRSLQGFHREAVTRAAIEGTLRLYLLFVDETPVAGYYGFFVQRRAYYYIGGFDPYWAKFSVGNLLIAHAMEDAQGEGAEAFDFLRGRESYKYRWGATDRETFTWRLR